MFLKRLFVFSALSCAIATQSIAQAAPGDLDTASFNPEGLVSSVPGLMTDDFSESRESTAYTILVQPADQKLIAVGVTRQSESYFQALTRLETDGSLDTSFGVSGNAVTPHFTDSSTESAFGAVLQDDGKIVVVGRSNTIDGSLFAVARYLSDGSLDPAFNGTGYNQVPPIGDARINYFLDVGLQSDGKIVAAGYSTSLGGDDSFALMRFNTDGSIDTTFGPNGNGAVFMSFGVGYDSQALALAVQDDDKVVLAGYTTSSSLDFNMTLARYTAAGISDPSFGSSGVLMVDQFPGSHGERANAVFVQPDGKIVVAGMALLDTVEFALFRCDASGNPDSGFGSGGYVLTEFPGLDAYALSAVLADSGKIVVGGYAGTIDLYNIALARYESDGSLDDGFGSAGTSLTDFSSNTLAGKIALQADGKIVAAGFQSFQIGPRVDAGIGISGSRFAIARFLGDTADLSLTKSADTSSPNLGDNVTYTLTVANAGPDASGGVVLTDPLPAGLDFVSVESSQGACEGGDTVVCDLGSIANGSSATVTVVATVTSEGEITNTATIDPGQAVNSSPSGNLTASATVSASSSLGDLEGGIHCGLSHGEGKRASSLSIFVSLLLGLGLLRRRAAC